MGPGDIAIFPLAFPVIAGPAGLTAVLLLMGQANGDPLGSMIVLGSMLLCLLLTYIGMIFTDVLHNLLRACLKIELDRDSGVAANMIHTSDVDTQAARPNGPDRPEDQALPI
jgi:multiple antibiotic resistance protein